MNNEDARDEDLSDQHAEWLEDWNRQKAAILEENREEWQKAQDALPEWIRARLEHFHEKGGENFALEGWGYELVIAELAVAYADMGEAIVGKSISEIEDSETVKAIAESQGTTGNQHSFALALAQVQVHIEDDPQTLRGTVSALLPLTGEPFYEEKS